MIRNYLDAITNNNSLIYNTSDFYNIHIDNDHAFIKLTFKFIKNYDGLPLNMVIFFPLSLAKLGQSIKLLVKQDV